MNAEQIAKLKELAQAMPSAPFGYSFGTGYVARKTENSYFHVAQAPSGMSSTMEWERSASFIAALLEAAPELIALAERTTAPVSALSDSDIFSIACRTKFWEAPGGLAFKQMEDIVSFARALLAAAPAIQQPQDERAAIEEAAKAIYPLLPGDEQGSPADHPWQEGGNSNMQDLARRMARAAVAKKGGAA